MARLNVNGKVREFQAEGDTPLLWVLREQLGLTGTKYGCGIAQCGACTVHIDGVATRSCVRPVSTVKASEKVVTIEGLSKNGSHPVQQAWAALDVPQCGFCQAGMIMAAAALLKSKRKPTDADINEAMTNICRCGTYNRVRAAIKLAAEGGDIKAAALGDAPAACTGLAPHACVTAMGPVAMRSTVSLRETAHESVRESARESARESVRESARESAHEASGEPQGQESRASASAVARQGA